MSGLLRKDELVAVVIDIDGEKRKMVEDIADTVLRRVLEEEDNDIATNTSTPADSSHASSSSSVSSSPLSINQLLSSSFSSQPSTPQTSFPTTLNPFQLALCQSLVANNANRFPVFGGATPLFPLFVPPPQPSVESVELLRIFQSILSKQNK